MNIIWGCCIIIFSVLLVFKYRPKAIQSFVMVAMSISTGLICAAGIVSFELMPSWIMFVLQMVVVVCSTVQLRREYKLRRASRRRIISVTIESRGVTRKNVVVNNIPTVTA